MKNKFFSEHFFLILFLTYKKPKIKFFFKKKFINYSFSRSYLRKKVRNLFIKIKKFIFGNNIYIYVKKKINKNKYIVWRNFSKKIFFEIYLLFIKVFLYYK